MRQELDTTNLVRFPSLSSNFFIQQKSMTCLSIFSIYSTERWTSMQGSLVNWFQQTDKKRPARRAKQSAEPGRWTVNPVS